MISPKAEIPDLIVSDHVGMCFVSVITIRAGLVITFRQKTKSACTQKKHLFFIIKLNLI